jgi:H+/Cl- antiporter ClcA
LYVAALQGIAAALGPDQWGHSAHVAVLVIVGGAIALMTRLLGNPGDVELLVDNIHLSGGRYNIRELCSLIPVSLLGIGAGSAIGPEAPLVQTTGSIGCWVATRFRLPVGQMRVLTITGMAAGFTVLFGVPLGSAIFALEILHRSGLEYYEALLPAGIGSLAGYAVYVGTTGLGLEPIWQFPEPKVLGPVDLGVGALAGVAGAIVAVGFIHCTRILRRGFRALPPGAGPILGGLVLGGLGLVSPFALTFGEGQVQSIVSNHFAVSALLLAAGAKFIASSAVVSSGWRGGFIVPLFFMGAALGSAGAQVMPVDHVVAMLAMMAAINTGVTKTPFASSLVVTEMAGLSMLPPVLLASLVSLFLTSHVSMIQTQREREARA